MNRIELKEADIHYFDYLLTDKGNIPSVMNCIV